MARQTGAPNSDLSQTPLDPGARRHETPAAMRLLTQYVPWELLKVFLMRLLTRYVLWELLKVFFVALTALTVMLLIVGLVKQARDEGLGPAQVLMLIPYILPDMLRYTIRSRAWQTENSLAICSNY